MNSQPPAAQGSVPAIAVLHEDMKILMQLTVKLVTASSEKAGYQRTLAEKHLAAMARRHGVEVTERAVESVLAQLDRQASHAR